MKSSASPKSASSPNVGQAILPAAGFQAGFLWGRAMPCRLSVALLLRCRTALLEQLPNQVPKLAFVLQIRIALRSALRANHSLLVDHHRQWNHRAIHHGESHEVHDGFVRIVVADRKIGPELLYEVGNQ